MKRALVLLAVGLAGAVEPAMAGDEGSAVRTCARLESYRSCDISRHEKALMISLGHEIDGVVESAIREVTLIKMARPEISSPRICEKLQFLSISGRTATIRMKAMLASLVYENPAWFVDERSAEFLTDDEAFGAVLNGLRRTLIASSR